MAKFNVTGEQYFSIDGQMLEIKRQLRLKSGSPIDPELVGLALQDIVEGKFDRFEKNEKKSALILRVISGNEKLMIEALDGKAYISDAKKTFKSGIDGDFKNWGLNQSCPATAETLLDVSEMTSDGTFVQIFTDISSDLEKLVMTQAQIIRFCEKHPTWLRQEGYATFFLTKVNGEYFVVLVFVSSDGLHVFVFRLEYVTVWYGAFRLRVVSPQLIPLAE